MQRHRSEWDVTTAEGREALEYFLMTKMGYRLDSVFEGTEPFWSRGDDIRDIGWIFTPEGMVEAKRWAAKEYEWEIGTRVFADSARAYILDWGGYEVCNEVEAEDEPTAVALALARALEEMDSQAGGDGS